MQRTDGPAASVMITGASSGIGEAVAMKLAERGSRLALLARNLAELEMVAARCRDRGASCLETSSRLCSPEVLHRMLTPKVTCRVIGTCHPQKLFVPSAVATRSQPNDPLRFLVESSVPPAPRS